MGKGVVFFFKLKASSNSQRTGFVFCRVGDGRGCLQTPMHLGGVGDSVIRVVAVACGFTNRRDRHRQDAQYRKACIQELEFPHAVTSEHWSHQLTLYQTKDKESSLRSKMLGGFWCVGLLTQLVHLQAFTELSVRCQGCRQDNRDILNTALTT